MPVNRSPPAMLPNVTGIWFQIHQSENDTSAPNAMPAGMTNMLTTECSNPWAKKVMIGSHIAPILPMVEVDVNAMTTPMVTSQLHSIALKNTSFIPVQPLFSYATVLAIATDLICSTTGVPDFVVAMN